MAASLSPAKSDKEKNNYNKINHKPKDLISLTTKIIEVSKRRHIYPTKQTRNRHFIYQELKEFQQKLLF